MQLYRGSNVIVQNPEYGKGKPYNDYGLGFYCTQHMEMAMEWAVQKDRDGFVNCYEIDLSGLRILNLQPPDCSTLEWLSVLLQNREFDAPSGLAFEAKQYLKENFTPDYQNADAITGYRADDSYFSFAQDFINGTISYPQLQQAMQLGELGIQYVLKSKKAFNRIKYTGFELAKSSDWYTQKMHRDLNARRDYFELQKSPRKRGDLYITHILDQEIKKDDPRLR